MFTWMVSMCLYTLVPAQEVQIRNTSFFEVPEKYIPSRGRLLGIGLAGSYSIGMSGLYATWYKNYPSSSFHLFNDNNEWLQMDKVGHVGSVYYLSRWTSGLVRWTGVSEKKAALYGTGTAYLFLTTIEVFDGFSAQWGVSPGDIAANTLGAGIYLSQQLVWNEQRITFKFSWHEDPLAKLRPETFGSTLPEKVLKDYNGQTYWLSGNIKSLFGLQKMPAWLNVAVGYGAGGMLTAERDEATPEGRIDTGNRYRQFYLSPDIDWTRIPTRSQTLKTVFKVINFIKIPAPALEYRSNGNWKIHGLYF